VAETGISVIGQHWCANLNHSLPAAMTACVIKKVAAWLEGWLARGDRLVHMIREPFELSASYYQFHRGGNEIGRGGWSMYDYQRIRRSSLRDGVLFVAQRVIDEQLPLMTAVYQMLQRHNTSSIDEQVFVQRMEKTATEFSASVQRLVRFLGVPLECSRSGTRLALQLAQHDTSRWSTLQLQSDPHVHNNRKIGASWQNRTAVLQALHSDGDVAAALRKAGRSLGYHYDIPASRAWTAAER